VAKRRTTIRDLAEHTGLSPAAVSYALRGMHVSAETEQRVREAAEELGYEADPMARREALAAADKTAPSWARREAAVSGPSSPTQAD